MRRTTFITILAGILLLYGCNKTKPQAPSHRTEQNDTTQLALVLLNQRMAEEADKELIHYIQQEPDTYTLDTYGYWYRYNNHTQLPHLQKDQYVVVKAQIYDLQDQLLTDSEETICIGKKQVIPVIDQMLPQLREGEECTLLAPWYTAFGPIGSDAVPPYTNVKIKLQTQTIN
ncbi:MAG: FKBP-type peptidyl-prolyl cis-trans isomerase [Paludibacter sp.]|nr:FKBP-type peptidyl-prolyl cis-trans isomerase [Bacteroidales bacterium]MCM1068759.1 FKBP-type peptidyl-prolyl cis-trans isomerase [Prevotella sp.]MCM1354471.1 FKBP-type peptidyl-prolyl cis-trans isomerase [Bacteroides sp.]MCM1443274.1 FKBP-type peptidyl-prolyl cis-trans isomerase [Muribaculum sp.]MCM1481041.1 FKBP-type peptidyl-prolyl cis-trans isomerase [Paludibacter sp.]